MHWLNGDRVLTFNVQNELSWLVPAPVPASEFMAVPEACIGESEGRLSYVFVSEQGVHVWCLEDYYNLDLIFEGALCLIAHSFALDAILYI